MRLASAPDLLEVGLAVVLPGVGSDDVRDVVDELRGPTYFFWLIFCKHAEEGSTREAIASGWRAR